MQFLPQAQKVLSKDIDMWITNLYVNANKEHLKAILRRINMEDISTDFKFAVTAEMETVASPKAENLESKLRLATFSQSFQTSFVNSIMII